MAMTQEELEYVRKMIGLSKPAEPVKVPQYERCDGNTMGCYPWRKRK